MLIKQNLLLVATISILVIAILIYLARYYNLYEHTSRPYKSYVSTKGREGLKSISKNMKGVIAYSRKALQAIHLHNGMIIVYKPNGEKSEDLYANHFHIKGHIPIENVKFRLIEANTNKEAYPHSSTKPNLTTEVGLVCVWGHCALDSFHTGG